MPSPELAAQQKTFSRMITIVARRWKAEGWTRRGQGFNRRTDAGVVQAMTFQKFATASQAARDLVMGGADWYAGRFALSYAVVVPVAWEAFRRRSGNPDAWCQVPAFVDARYAEPFHRRIGGEFWPDDANSLSHASEDIARDVLRVYDDQLAPLFGEVRSVREVIENFDRGGLLGQEADHMDEEALAYMLASTGHKARAAEILQRLCDGATHRGPGDYADLIATYARQSLGIELRT